MGTKMNCRAMSTRNAEQDVTPESSASYFEPSRATPKLLTWPGPTVICCEYSGNPSALSVNLYLPGTSFTTAGVRPAG